VILLKPNITGFSKINLQYALLRNREKIFVIAEKKNTYGIYGKGRIS
jgi:hypothetical protein